MPSGGRGGGDDKQLFTDDILSAEIQARLYAVPEDVRRKKLAAAKRREIAESVISRGESGAEMAHLHDQPADPYHAPSLGTG